MKNELRDAVLAVETLNGMPLGVKTEALAYAARALVLSENVPDEPVTVTHPDGTVEIWKESE